MEDVVQDLVPSVYGLALWDSEWNSYTNSYLIRRGRGYLLIDGHKDGQREQLAAGLGRIAVVPDRIDVFIATHGHKDHVDASSLLTTAARWIHVGDKDLVGGQAKLFGTIEGGRAELYGLSVARGGHHTPGSIVLYDAMSQCLFCGDFVCCFREILPASGL